MTNTELDRIALDNHFEINFNKLSLSEEQKEFIHLFCCSLQRTTKEDKGHAKYKFVGTKHPNIMILHGYAGTGKTTLVKHLCNLLPGLNVSIMTYTGKASQVLMMKGIESSTIHRNIYRKVEQDEETGEYYILKEVLEVAGDGTEELIQTKMVIKDKSLLRFKNEWVLNLNPNEIGDIIFVDEYSMIGKSIYNDLQLLGVPIMLIGDPGQLPPIGDDALGNLDADFTLWTNFRQGKGNPINDLALQIRDGDTKPANCDKEVKDGDNLLGHVKIEFADGLSDLFGDPDSTEAVFKGVRDTTLLKFATSDTQILVGTNQTRTAFNQHIRQLRGNTDPFPEYEEKLIILGNNYNIYCRDNYSKVDVVNGMQIIVKGLYWVDSDAFDTDIEHSIINCYTDRPAYPDQVVKILKRLRLWKSVTEEEENNVKVSKGIADLLESFEAPNAQINGVDIKKPDVEQIKPRMLQVLDLLTYIAAYYVILEFIPSWAESTRYNHSFCLIPKNTFDKKAKEVPQDKLGYKLNKLAIKCDYGYAITVHKSQGSEWHGILLIQENYPFKYDEIKRWMYTGVTRAQRELELVKWS